MGIFARIEAGRVREVIHTDRLIAELFHPALVWVAADVAPGVAEGWSYDGTRFAPPLAPAAGKGER